MPDKIENVFSRYVGVVVLELADLHRGPLGAPGKASVRGNARDEKPKQVSAATIAR